MENFFLFFEKKTGLPEAHARQAIKIVSGHLARHHKKEFALIIQYFLASTFDQKKTSGRHQP